MSSPWIHAWLADEGMVPDRAVDSAILTHHEGPLVWYLKDFPFRSKGGLSRGEGLVSKHVSASVEVSIVACLKGWRLKQ